MPNLTLTLHEVYELGSAWYGSHDIGFISEQLRAADQGNTPDPSDLERAQAAVRLLDRIGK